MPSLQFLIDHLCARFTVEAMYELVRTRLSGGPCSLDDLAAAVAQSDRSLDLKSARQLAEAAVEALAQAGQVAVEGEQVRAVR